MRSIGLFDLGYSLHSFWQWKTLQMKTMAKLNWLVLILGLIQVQSLNAQRDSISLLYKPAWYNDTEIVIPSALLTLGIMTYVSPVQSNVQKSLTKYRSRWVGMEDYLQFAPLVIQATANIFDAPSKNGYKQQLKYLAISELSTLSMVYILKKGINEQRPNGGKWSFPSGHTAQGFVAAGLLYQEYKDEMPILAYSGYSMAIATGILRMTHNKHWINDVLFGAGLGMLIPNIIYKVNMGTKGRDQGRIQYWMTSNAMSIVYSW